MSAGKDALRAALVDELRACTHPRAAVEVLWEDDWCTDCGAVRRDGSGEWIRPRIVARLEVET